jgi:hypothetical protein
MSSLSIERSIEALAELDHADLKARWRALLGDEPPKGISRPLLRLALAYAVQEQAFGGLDRVSRRRLQRLGTELKSKRRITSPRAWESLKPGTRLIRVWQGCTQEVTVLEHGFEWNGATYRSLSAIARAITGTRWNGHVFFGVKQHRCVGSTGGSQGMVRARERRVTSNQQEGADG